MEKRRKLFEQAIAAEDSGHFLLAGELFEKCLSMSRAPSTADAARRDGDFQRGHYQSSKANTSDVAHVALSMRYTSPDVEFEMEKWSDPGRIKTLLVRGVDEFHLNDAIRGEKP